MNNLRKKFICVECSIAEQLPCIISIEYEIGIPKFDCLFQKDIEAKWYEM